MGAPATQKGHRQASRQETVADAGLARPAAPGTAVSRVATSDGWRGVAGEQVTAEFVRQVARRLAAYDPSGSVLVGFDTRFLSEYLADVATVALAESGLGCVRTVGPVPTPVLAWAVRAGGHRWGIQVTASHNPAIYHGVKLRCGQGAPVPPAVLDRIEATPPAAPKLGGGLGVVEQVDPVGGYASWVAERVDLEAVARRFATVVVDAMHGATAGLLRRVLPGSVEVVGVRQGRDPTFGGIPPEPKPATLRPLGDAVAAAGGAVGFAHDGDGDRVVAWDRQLGYVSPHDLGAVLALDAGLCGQVGALVASATTTRRVRRLAAHFGMPFVETDVGFHHAAAVMAARPVAVAVEENGGVAFGDHLPDRDGTFAALRLLAALARHDASLAELLQAAAEVTGPAAFVRADLPAGHALPPWDAGALAELAPARACGVERVQPLHRGVRVDYADGAWVALRRAGTEPLLRVYVEADSAEQARELAEVTRARLASQAR